MTEKKKDIKKDIINVKNRIKDARMNLKKDVIKEKAKKSGKNIEDYSNEEFDKLDHIFSDLFEKLSTEFGKFIKEPKHPINEISEEIKTIHQIIKDERHNITGGYIEDKTINALHITEKKLNKIIKKIKEDMELNSKLDLMRDLK